MHNPHRYRVLARAFVTKARKGHWWKMASFMFESDARTYWENIPRCWEAKLMNRSNQVAFQESDHKDKN